MTNSKWLSLLRRRTDEGRSQKQVEREEDSFCGTPNVSGEYLEAFRTKSYVEICNKAHKELRNINGSTSFNINLSEHVLEPRQEIIANMKVHRLLVDYFEASLEACHCCDTILQAIHQTRHAYARVTSIVVKLSQTAPYYDDQSQNPIHTELSSLVLQLQSNNPLSIISPVQFRDIHDRYTTLLRKLSSKKGKIQRILTIKRVCKKLTGLVAAPCIASFFGLKCESRVNNGNYSNSKRLLCEQVDVAAKGVYVVINELDTMSRMVKRLDDEVEHWREVADISVKNCCKCELLNKRVVKEFQDNESNFLNMLEELQDHIYLCFLTVNRSRRLLMQEITKKQR